MNKIEFKNKEEFLAYINSSIWVIQPEALSKAVGAFQQKLDSGRPLKDVFPDESYNGYGYDVVGRVAVIHIKGVIEKDYMLGWTEASTEMIMKDLQNALDNNEVETIVLNIDSPGGTVPGVKELSDAVYAARQIKPVYAFSDSRMTSAAYWIGSATTKVYGTDTAYFGSIGVFIMHRDISVLLNELGINITLIKAGKFKAIGNPFGVLSEADREVLQTRVDKAYNIFIEAISRNRGKETAYVKENMAEGRVFNGRDSVKAGLVDELVTLQDLVNLLHIDNPAVFIQPIKEESKMVLTVTKDTLKEKFSSVYDEVHAEGKSAGVTEEKAKTTAAVDAAKAETQKAERERASKILELADDSQKQLALKLYSDGKTVEEATEELLKDSQKTKKEGLKNFAKDAPKPAEPGKGDETVSAEDALYQSYLKKFDDDPKFAASYDKAGGKTAMIEHLKEWKESEKVREEFGNQIESFLAERRARR